MATMQEIEKLAAEYAGARNLLAAIADELDETIRAVKEERMQLIRDGIATVNATREALRKAVAGAAPLFERPRTRILHGIKFGWQKGKGGLEWDDDAKVIAKIRQLYDDQIGVLVRVTEKPIKDALAQLPASDLKKLGITIVDAGDQVIVKPMEGDVERFIGVLLKVTEKPAANGKRKKVA